MNKFLCMLYRNLPAWPEGSVDYIQGECYNASLKVPLCCFDGSRKAVLHLWALCVAVRTHRAQEFLDRHAVNCPQVGEIQRVQETTKDNT